LATAVDELVAAGVVVSRSEAVRLAHDRRGAVVSALPSQGEIWWAEAGDKRRPVLTWIVVAPVTRTVRAVPSEVRLGAGHGLSEECAASFDNVQPIRRSFLTERVGASGIEELDEICRALRALADC